MTKLFLFRTNPHTYRLPILAAALGLTLEFVFPQAPALAQSLPLIPPEQPVYTDASGAALSFPEAGARAPRYVVTVPVTAYSSTPDQTDGNPFITASGTHVRWGVVAANFLPIGTHVRIPDRYGDQVFVVEDRMNARYDVRLDIWMQTRAEAQQWGLRRVKLEVL